MYGRAGSSLALMFLVVLLQSPPGRARDLEFELRPEFEIGEGEPYLGRVSDVAWHPSGALLVLDAQRIEVLVFDEAGAFLRTLGREGEAPGEFRQPYAVFVDEAGIVHVTESMPPKLCRYTLDGEILDDLRVGDPGGYRLLTRARMAGGLLYCEELVAEISAEGATNHTSLRVRDLDAGTERELLSGETPFHLPGETVILREDDGLPFRGRWDVLSDGSVVAITSFAEYDAQRFGPDGGVVERYERLRVSPIVRSDAARDRAVQRFEDRLVRGGSTSSKIEYEPSDHVRLLSRVFVRSEGEVWLARTPESLVGPDALAADRPAPSLVVDRFVDGDFVGRGFLHGPEGMEAEHLWVAGDRVIWRHRPGPSDDPETPTRVEVFGLVALR